MMEVASPKVFCTPTSQPTESTPPHHHGHARHGKSPCQRPSTITFFTSWKRIHYLLTCWRHSYRVCTCRCWPPDLLISEQLEGAYDVVNCTVQHKPRTTSYTVASSSFMSEVTHGYTKTTPFYLPAGNICSSDKSCEQDDIVADVMTNQKISHQNTQSQDKSRNGCVQNESPFSMPMLLTSSKRIHRCCLELFAGCQSILCAIKGVDVHLVVQRTV